MVILCEQVVAGLYMILLVVVEVQRVSLRVQKSVTRRVCLYNIAYVFEKVSMRLLRIYC